jgi:hypothetical protein
MNSFAFPFPFPFPFSFFPLFSPIDNAIRPGVDPVRLPAIVLLSGVLMIGGCRPEPAGPSGPEIGSFSADVAASRVPGGVRLTNNTDRPIAYAVWNRGWLALFAPCIDTGPECLRLAPGASIMTPDSEIDGWAPGAVEAVVRWWDVVPDDAGGVRAGEVHEIFVKL